MNLHGIHHVTAITGHAENNLAFYTKVLGMRLVKKTVNQDVTSTYHLFYADRLGSPGTDMTFFDWPDVGRNIIGAGEVSTTGFIVPRDSLEWWKGRLEANGTKVEVAARDDRTVMSFSDGEGQRLELIAGEGGPGVPWSKSPAPPEYQIRGIASVTLMVETLEPTASFLEKMLGFRRTRSYRFADNQSREAQVFETGDGGLGSEVYLETRPDMPRARTGIGGVHHVAFRSPDEEEHKAWRERLARSGASVTPVIDRFYFQSIYFREPGGVLFEIATDGPGFAADEDVEHLGEKLSLPPFLEHRRKEIEAALPPIAA